jgi:hypothetical protein
MSSIDIKTETFCRFTKLRKEIKTQDFLNLLMDTYEKSLIPIIEESKPVTKSIKKKIQKDNNNG